MIIEPPVPPGPPGLPAPQPDPSSLADQVDWMTYSHQQLYDMVNNGMDLAAAGNVSSSWMSLSDTLNDFGHELSTALNSSSDGWQGTAADKARESLTSLVGWLHTTGEGAVGVSGCLSRQVAAANTARTTMPVPVQDQTIPQSTPITQPGPVAHPGTIPFTAGPGIMRPPLQSELQAQEAHQQAAQVMQQYQTTSYDIFRTVPEFASPTGRRENVVRQQPPPEPGPPQPTPVPPPDSGTPVFARPGAIPIGARGAGLSGGSGAAGSSGSSGMDEGEPRAGMGAGAESGVGGSSSGAAASAGADRMSAQERPGQSMAGGLGGGAGGRRTDDKERRTPQYLEEDSRIFMIDGPTTPPVIGG